MAHHDDARLTEVLSEIVGDADTKAVFRRLLQQALQELIETELSDRAHAPTATLAKSAG